MPGGEAHDLLDLLDRGRRNHQRRPMIIRIGRRERVAETGESCRLVLGMLDADDGDQIGQCRSDVRWVHRNAHWRFLT
jgi:hypothetical protein